MRKSGWHWEYVVLAPTGDAIPGATGTTADRAIASFLPNPRDWLFAQAQGYRLRYDRVENDEDVVYPATNSGSGQIAGRITHGRGALWGAGLV